MKIHTTLRLFSIPIITIILFGCAPTKKLPEIIWPLPPDPPKIRFDKSFSGAKEFYGGSLAGEILLGEDPSGVFSKPNGLHTDKADRVYVSDTGSGLVQIFDPKADHPMILEAGGRSPFTKPIGIATDNKGNIYVSDSGGDIVYIFGADLQFISVIGHGGEVFKQPTGLAVDNERKRLYIVDTHKHQVTAFDIDTLKPLFTIGKRGRDDGEFNFPSFIVLDKKGNLYIVDTMNGRVQVFDPDGRFLRKWGRLGDGPGMFARPKGIAMDSEGHVYVVDSAFNNVQIFDQEGQILMAFGAFGEGRGGQILPAGIAIDSEDRIYVADQWNERINIFEYMGEKYKARAGAKK
ncbi:MAG: 6-bladed beta-propeller [Deltaproteobacteria bacterium]|nr:6-bladed beta-propeller [Deltaproteobacteria bacterium]